jgi:hypothetical protein
VTVRQFACWACHRWFFIVEGNAPKG